MVPPHVPTGWFFLSASSLQVHHYFKRFFENKSALDETAVLNDMEPTLRAKCATHLLGATVASRTGLFYVLAHDMLDEVCPCLRSGISCMISSRFSMSTRSSDLKVTTSMSFFA